MFAQFNLKGVVMFSVVLMNYAKKLMPQSYLSFCIQNQFGNKLTALDWTKWHLGNRSSFMHINSKTSPPTVTSFGGPQGSVLVPNIFTIYTTPLADIIKHHNLSYHVYADDTQLYITSDPKSQSSLQESIACVEKSAMDIKNLVVKENIHAE